MTPRVGQRHRALAPAPLCEVCGGGRRVVVVAVGRDWAGVFPCPACSTAFRLPVFGDVRRDLPRGGAA